MDKKWKNAIVCRPTIAVSDAAQRRLGENLRDLRDVSEETSSMSLQGDLSEISKSALIEMSLRRCMRRLKDASQMHHCWLGNLFLRSTVIVWNKLDPNLWSTASVFKKSLLKFIRPSPNSAFNYHNCKGIKNLTSLQLGLNHLREHKFKHKFQDTLNPFGSSNLNVETNLHFYHYCPSFSK